MESIKWKLADILSRIAVWLRGQRWYHPDNWGGVPGNRAAELKQTIWERCCLLDMATENKNPDWLKQIDTELSELGQLAGENCGRIWPNETKGE